MKRQSRLIHALYLLVLGIGHSWQACPADEACESVNVVCEWVSSRVDAAQTPSLQHDFSPYQLHGLLFSRPPAERGASLSRCLPEKNRRESGTPWRRGESSISCLRCFPSSSVDGRYSCSRSGASVQKRHVLGRYGCTMQPPFSDRHKCKKTKANPPDSLTHRTTSSAGSYVSLHISLGLYGLRIWLLS